MIYIIQSVFKRIADNTNSRLRLNAEYDSVLDLLNDYDFITIQDIIGMDTLNDYADVRIETGCKVNVYDINKDSIIFTMKHTYPWVIAHVSLTELDQYIKIPNDIPALSELYRINSKTNWQTK